MFGLSEFHFKLLMQIIIVHSTELERVILFGTRARRDHLSHSDIDLAVLYKIPQNNATLSDEFETSALPNETNNPRDTIRESIKQNLIQDHDTSLWFGMIEKRNLTTHTYHYAIA